MIAATGKPKSGWKECRLGDVASKIGSGATPTGGGNSYKTSGITFIRSQNVEDFGFSADGLAFIDDEQADALKNVSVQKNDILMNITGESVTRCCIAPEEYLPARVNQHVSIIRPRSEDADFKYLFYYLHSIKPELNSIAEVGCTRRALTKEMLENLAIPLPSIPEQCAISSVLSSLDDKITLLHRQNKTLEGLAAALWRKMFVEEARTEWNTTTVGEVATINGKNINKDYPFEEIEYLDTGSITEGLISEYQHLQLKAAPSRAKRIVQKNDIVVSMVRPIQKHYGILKKVNPNTIASTGFVVISCHKIDPHFLYVLLTQKEMTEFLDIIAEASTTTYPSLAPSDIEKIDFQMPPAELLKQFAEYAAYVWDKIEENNSQIRILSRLRDALLPKLMSGEIKVRYAES